MLLSVIIVNYNVKHFLRQCLGSVQQSAVELADGSTLGIETWVVDNDSVDGSVEMVRAEFPNVHIIDNHCNVGFAKANNQAIARCHGDLILLLNPDTVLEHNTLATCANFMLQHPQCGGLTVKLIDGKGRFLKESKRGFPTPQAAFYKISGLVRLFPHHRRIAAYYMGHLGEDDVNEIEIMCGAYLMLRRQVYEQIGGLDESYFMYGEDIDYSWRIHLAGWQNYYLPTTHIIHYKGESTRKGSMNYVYTFYNAMSIFVRKYFSGKGAKLFGALLRIAIWARATMAWLSRIGQKVFVPLADFMLAYGGWLLIKYLWEPTKGAGHTYYPPEYTLFVVPLYILILMLCCWLGGGYDRPVKVGRIVRGMGTGLILLLAFYSLLDESQRYSRMLVLLGSLWTITAAILIRLLLSAMHAKGYALRSHANRSTIVVGTDEETNRIAQLYGRIGIPQERLVATTQATAPHLQALIRIEHADEVIFCGRDIELRTIINLMATLRTTGVEYRIAPPESDCIIGSETILSPDDLYITNLDTISTDTARRSKRLFDISASLLLLLLSPVLFWFQKRKRCYYGHCLAVLVGNVSWVGYTGHRGIFAPADLLPSATTDLSARLLLRYMRHYTTAIDFRILLNNWNNI